MNSIQVSIKQMNGSIILINMNKPFNTFELKKNIQTKINIPQCQQYLYIANKEEYLEDIELFIKDEELKLYNNKPFIIYLIINNSITTCITFNITNIDSIVPINQIKNSIKQVFNIPFEEITYENLNKKTKIHNHESILDKINLIMELIKFNISTILIPLNLIIELIVVRKIDLVIKLNELLYITNYFNQLYVNDLPYNESTLQVLSYNLTNRLNQIFKNIFTFSIIIECM